MLHGLHLGGKRLLSQALPPSTCAGMYGGHMVMSVRRDGAMEEGSVLQSMGELCRQLSSRGILLRAVLSEGWLFWEWRVVVNHRRNPAFPPC